VNKRSGLKKLTLNKETLGSLSPRSLAVIDGADSFTMADTCTCAPTHNFSCPDASRCPCPGTLTD
jgi:hypothetical protein